MRRCCERVGERRASGRGGSCRPARGGGRSPRPGPLADLCCVPKSRRRVACATPLVTALDWIIVALTLRRRPPATSRASWSAPRRSPASPAGLFARRAPRAGRAVGGDRSRPTRRSSGSSGALLGGAAPRLGARGARLRPAAAARPGRRSASSTALAGAVLSAGVALGLVWLAGAVVAADAPGARPARRHPALGDPARAQRPAAAVGPDPQRAGALRPLPAHRRARRSTCRAPRGGDRARSRRAARRPRGVVKIHGTACGLGVEGSGWVAARRARGDQRARRRRARTTRRSQLGGARPTLGGAGGRLRPAQRRRRPARRRAWRAARCRSPPTRRAARSAAILGFPQNGPYDVRAGAPGRHARGHHAGRLRPRAGARARSSRCAARCARATRAARWSTARGRVRRRRSSRRPRSGPPGGYGVPNAVVGAALVGRPTGGAPVATGPCAALSYPARVHGQDPRHRREAVRRARTSRACCPARSRSTPERGTRPRWLEGPEHVVTWAVGHLVQLAEPDEYDDKLQEVADGRPADRPARLQARRARRALRRSR